MPEQLLRIENVAELLQLRPSGVRALIYRGSLPYIRLSGRILRFRLHDIENYLRLKTVPANPTKEQPRSERRRRTKTTTTNNYVETLVDCARRDAAKGSDR